jgi:hypothetical protein
MLTLQALLGALPSARLAEADLPRFLTQALGRMTTEQLGEAATLLEQEQLVGYPRALTPVMRCLIVVLLEEELQPRNLEPALFEQLIGAPRFLSALDEEVGLDHMVLRPGELVSPEMRELVGRHLRVLPGIGPHLTMVAPAEVSCLPGLSYAVVRSAVLARPMSNEEADAVQSAWAVLEEASGWPHGQSREWEARFVRASIRPNWPAAVCIEHLSGMQPPRRRALWLALVGHQRLQELPETHRAGAAALSRRLDQLSLEDDARECIPQLLQIVRAAYLSCGLYTGSALGDYPVTLDDVDAYIEWVEHPDGAKSVLASQSAEQLQRLLRQMTAVELGTLQVDLDTDKARILRLFRDQYLAAVYRRDTSTLLGVDPLLLAQSYVSEGADQGVILAALKQLAEDARMQRELAMEAARVAPAAASEEVAPLEVEPDSGESPFAALVPRTPSRPTTSPGVNPFAASKADEAPHRIPTTTPLMKLPPLPEVPLTKKPRTRTTSSMSLPALPDRPARPRSARPRTRPRTQPFPDLDSMPLPKPVKPEVRRSASRPKITAPSAGPLSEQGEGATVASELAALNVPGEAAFAAQEASPEPPLDVQEDGADASQEMTEVPPQERESEEPPASQAELNFAGSLLAVEAEAGDMPPPDLPPIESRPPASRRHTGRLVTPGQAARFYSDAFRELQVLERDLLERGAWPSARRRVQALGEEASELALSLGPPARSGDVDFKTALKKVELVQSYLDRIGPLMSTAPRPIAEPEASGVLDRFSGMFKRGEHDS